MRPDIDTYRVTTDRWKRTWQAEWSCCWFAPRAWTERGVIRKAERWMRQGTDLKRHRQHHREVTG